MLLCNCLRIILPVLAISLSLLAPWLKWTLQKPWRCYFYQTIDTVWFTCIKCVCRAVGKANDLSFFAKMMKSFVSGRCFRAKGHQIGTPLLDVSLMWALDFLHLQRAQHCSLVSQMHHLSIGAQMMSFFLIYSLSFMPCQSWSLDSQCL